jgi:hypothetical protein
MRVFALGVTVALLSLSATLTARPADAVIHEIVAAYCSGGDHGAIEGWELEPPGLTDPEKNSFAKPVLASGAVEVTFPEARITDKPNNKFEEGTLAANLITGDSDLSAATNDHPSAQHCPGAESLP